MSGRVVSINISEKKGTAKHGVERAEVSLRGMDGDAHSGTWHRQISLLAHEEVERFVKKTGRSTAHGEFAENITTGGLDLSRVKLFHRLHIGSVELEVTQLGKKCHNEPGGSGNSCAIFRDVGSCIMPVHGIFARVLSAGSIKTGDEIGHRSVPIKCKIITLSDRAACGEYDDLSGPRIVECLEAARFGFDLGCSREVIADERARLEESISGADADIIFTTGGTGIGPRDITPETILSLCPKTIPGIMEHIRQKHAARIPSALLSRSVAAVYGDRTLVFALPGSVKAVTEYMEEIIPLIEHAVLMLRGIGH
ncbi:MAG: hypothetical protein A2583_08715 [Bdellovibrionales bacterium RIFOXYD1_FULL_53_11]|nr:MAG: hypothetical protein A2583_08715 [Bdellovibrionales bacterium RIFOXYD1_FULL_53_11]